VSSFDDELISFVAKDASRDNRLSAERAESLASRSSSKTCAAKAIACRGALRRSTVKSDTASTEIAATRKGESAMQIKLASGLVQDQENALRFYTTVLGFEEGKKDFSTSSRQTSPALRSK
jgi:hypothetical protein